MKLYGYRNGRTLRALWTLEELTLQYEYVEVDVMHGEGQSAWFLAMNPAGKVPVLVDADVVITESAAICIHLAETHPASRLLPSLGTRERTRCFQWISFVLTELDAPLWTIAKHRFGLPSERRVPDVIATAAWEFERAADVLTAGLGEQRYLCDSFTVADIVAGHTLLWAKSSQLPLGSETLEMYVRALTVREAFRRAQDKAGAASNRDRNLQLRQRQC